MKTSLAKALRSVESRALTVAKRWDHLLPLSVDKPLNIRLTSDGPTHNMDLACHFKCETFPRESCLAFP